ncbi:glycosyltransferase family 2 protein [Enterovibrio makurazakiensis]|uniref:glycosyltransferase family 2 protein n=1 Tax=Enterovibrio makurazakiensis TaxID=2910232 RepID=UPI003D24C359
MKLSIVTTLYLSSPYIKEFYTRCVESAKLITDDYEIIFVNDGSPDDSLSEVKQIADIDKKVVIVNLSRNFGHHKAIMTGLEYSRGDRVFLLDSDLEEKPEWLTEFNHRIENEKCDVIYGVQEKRKGEWFERVSGDIYYRIINLFIEHPKDITTARLMTKQYVENLVRHQEREVVFSGLCLLTGFEQKSAVVKKTSKGSSTYSLRRKLSHLINTVTSFSSKPLIGIFFTGITISAITFLYAFSLIVNRLLFSAPVEGWTSIMVSVWLLGGIIISFIGLIGIYLSKIFTEVKRRPYTIVKEVVNGTLNRVDT